MSYISQMIHRERVRFAKNSVANQLKCLREWEAGDHLGHFRNILM